MVFFTDYFELIESQINNGVKYEAYKANVTRSSMVLFSKKTATPLAALVFQAEDSGVLSVLTSRPSPPASQEPFFQGMLNLPDQAFALSIVNLAEQGFINFNILHTPHRVNEVDPGPAYGINQVNELRPGRGYKIECDQRTGRQMVLSGRTKVTADGHTVKQTVDEAEQKTEREGLYFYLSVVAANSCPDLVAKFAEGTVWKCVSHFVRRVKAPVAIAKSASRGASSGYSERLSLGGRADCVNAASEAPPDHGDILLMDDAAHFVCGTGEDEECEKSEGEDDYDNTLESCPPATNSNAAHDITLEFHATERRDAGLPMKHSKKRKSAEEVAASGIAKVNVGQTQAGKLTYGRQIQPVYTRVTGEEYAYEHPSDPAVLCLSLHPDLQVLPLPEIRDILKEELKEWIENEGKILIEGLSKVYKTSDTCVIDLESPADTIVIQCGHQCLNHGNIQGLAKCPLCRAAVLAFVQADGLLLAR